jgi:GNAT superfamily N-acetyltransferase
MSETQANIEIRRARPDDTSALARLYALLSDDPIPDRDSQQAAFDEVAADQRQTIFVAEIDGRVAGTATVIVVPNLRTPRRPYAIVENVVVAESARRTGVATALMVATIDAARAAGCYKVALTSRLDRTEAHAFYERLGFVTTQRSFRMDL